MSRQKDRSEKFKGSGGNDSVEFFYLNRGEKKKEVFTESRHLNSLGYNIFFFVVFKRILSFGRQSGRRYKVYHLDLCPLIS